MAEIISDGLEDYCRAFVVGKIENQCHRPRKSWRCTCETMRCHWSALQTACL